MSWYERLDWKDFQPGVKRAEVVPFEAFGKAVVLLQYAAGARVPEHFHAGKKYIYVLDGSQQDEKGNYQTGEWVLNKPGSHHSVSSSDGCMVLLIYEEPVQWINREEP